MLMVYGMLGAGFFFLSWAMTNLPIGLLATLAVPVVSHFSNSYNGFLVGGIIAGIAWGNLPLGGGDHDHHHDDGHAHAHAEDTFWNPWGIAYRAVATVVVLAALSAFLGKNVGPAYAVLWTAPAKVVEYGLMVIVGGVACMALLVVFVILSNWGSAQAQG